jgi:DNA-directed RNA polymerase specialized sigma24 family protein
MQQTNTSLIDRDSYDEVMDFFRETSAELFQYLEIAEDLVNQAYLFFLKKGEAQDMDQQQLTELFPQIVEKVFAEYRKLCFGYCLGKTKDPEIAGDIAQETLAQLLASRLPIRNVRQWIRQVAHNLLCAYYQENHQDRVLYKKLGIECDIAHQILDNEELPAPELLADLLPEELKSSPDYQEYLILKQYSSLEDYARAQNISYDVAKRRSKKLLRDLGAKTLLALKMAPGSWISINTQPYKSLCARFLLSHLRTMAAPMPKPVAINTKY